MLNEPGYNAAPAPTENYGDDPIVIIDLIGKFNSYSFMKALFGPFAPYPALYVNDELKLTHEPLQLFIVNSSSIRFN